MRVLPYYVGSGEGPRVLSSSLTLAVQGGWFEPRLPGHKWKALPLRQACLLIKIKLFNINRVTTHNVHVGSEEEARRRWCSTDWSEGEKTTGMAYIKKLKFYKLRSLSGEAFLHYIGKEETDEGGDNQNDGWKKTKTTGLAHKMFHRTICLFMHMVDY